jgi:hypothetical protein
VNTHTLNIGLRFSPLNELAELCNVVETAEEVGLNPCEYETHGRTLVLTVEPSARGKSVLEATAALCRRLGREAIAVYDGQRGYVIGDRSFKYGEFDESKFHFLSPAPTAH